jgi:flagellar protein FlaG
MSEVSMNLVAPGAATVPRAVKAGDVSKSTGPDGMEATGPAAVDRPERAAESKRAPDRESDAIADAAEAINRTLAEQKRELRFAVDEASGRTLVYVMHAQTGEVVRQIPSEVMIAIAKLVENGEPMRSLGIEVQG